MAALLKIKLHWQILIAMVLAVVAGTLTRDPEQTSLAYHIYDFIGTLFLSALKMLIVPLIFSSIICGIANIGSDGALGRLGAKTISYYMATSLLSIVVGLFFVNVISPGLDDGTPVREQIGLSADTGEITSRVQGRGNADIAAVFLRMVPPNIVEAAANGRMLGLIFFGLLFGYFMTRLQGSRRTVLLDFWNALFEVMMLITEWVMKFAPLGVFGLVAGVVSSTGTAAFIPLAYFFLTVIAALAAHFFIVLPTMLVVLGKVNPVRHYRAMMPAILTAFSTSSSSATLPISMDCVEHNAGVSNRTTSFVLPLGATINMDGTALYECIAAVFIAQAYGVELGLVQQFTVVLTALLTSIGVAGIPAASLVAISIILGSIGLPLEAIGLILAVDRILDMCRTVVNIFSDSCGAVIIARSEGEKDILVS